MSKNLIYLIVTIVMISVTVQTVESLTLSPWGGLTYLTMDLVNKDLKARGAADPNAVLVKFSSSMVAGLDFGNLRFVYIMPAKASISWTDTTYSPSMALKNEITTDIAIGELGFRIPNPSYSIISIGIYVGGGQVTYNEKRSWDDGGTNVGNVNIPGIAQGPVAEAVLGIKLLGFIEISAAYRYAPFTITVTKAVTADFNGDGTNEINIAKNAILKDVSGKNLTFDYGGVMASVGFRFGPSKPKEQTGFQSFDEFLQKYTILKTQSAK
jgi:hypothetical protein